MSSTALVAKVKKILGQKHVGHLGTLDPAASGVLVVACQKATKFFDYFLNKDKVYFAIAEFGTLSDTLDSFGRVVEKDDINVELDDIKSIIDDFNGKSMQTPPLYSAVKINGVAAYKHARNNQSVQIKPKEIEVFNFYVIDKIKKNTFSFYIHCSSGTYVRSLLLSLAQKLDTVATTPVIIRLKSGPFNLKDAITLKMLESDPQKYLITIEDLFVSMKKINFESCDKKTIMNGGTVLAKAYNMSDNSEFLGYIDGKLFGLFSVNNGIIKCKINVYEE